MSKQKSKFRIRPIVARCSFHWRGLLPVVFSLFVSLPNGSVFGLDPDRAITQYRHDVWQSDQGLPQNSITAIAQTEDGYLWFGTQEGLVRFDGIQFSIFNSNNTPELKHNHITALCADREGSLWVGTLNGLATVKNGRFASYDTAAVLADERISSIYLAPDKSVWIGTLRGIARFRDGHFFTYTEKNGLRYGMAFAIRQNADGTIWTAKDGLARLSDGTFTYLTLGNGPTSGRPFAMVSSHDGSMWIATRDRGLYRYLGKNITHYTTEDGLPSNLIVALFEDLTGTLWIGTEQGLSRFNNGTFANYGMGDGLSHNYVTSIFEDREGSLWVGTLYGGLNRFTEGKFTVITTQEGLSDNSINSIIQASDGSVWIGTEVGLNHLKDGIVTSYRMKDGLPGDAISSLYESKDGSLWIGLRTAGLSRFRDDKFKNYTQKDGLPSPFVNAVLETRDGNLWIATDSDGLCEFRNGKFRKFSSADGMSARTTTSLLESMDGGLWIGSAAGVFLLKDGRFRHYQREDGLSNNIVKALYEDSEGSLWIGTKGGGLNLLRNGRLTSYTTREGLFNDSISDVIEDNRGTLWMTCDRGIFRVNKTSIEDYAQKRIPSIPYVSYDTADGLKTNEGGRLPRASRMTNGQLWFATTKGVAILDPASINVNTLIPPVVVEKVIANSLPVAAGGNVHLQPATRELEFHYTALSFVAPEKVKFKYKLEGFDKDWVDAGTRRVAYYTNLAPGQYNFRVIACNNDGVWNEAGTSFGFYLRPHFYQTKWFYATCVLALALLAFSLYRLRVKQLRRRTVELEQTVEERTQELKRSQAQVLKLEKQATEQRMAGGFAHEMRNALAGSKLVLDQALGINGTADNSISLNLENCRKLKEIYLNVKESLRQDKTDAVLAQMQAIFSNEERLSEILELVHKATSRGLNITQQIMDYSKMGQQQRGLDNVEIQEVIAGIIEEIRREDSKADFAIAYVTNGEPARVLGDETHFYSVFKNLILNARDAVTDPALNGGRDPQVQVSMRKDSDQIEVSITDNGIGIPEENLQKIFEPFFSTKPATGTGLGLGMVKNIVSLYDGTIEVTSRRAKGTTVTICFPEVVRAVDTAEPA